MKLARTFGIGLLVLSGLLATIRPESVQAVPLRESPPSIAPKPLDWKTTRVAFNVQERLWSELLEWFAGQSGTRFQAKCPLPKGKLAFDGHEIIRDSVPVYDLETIFDIINEDLMATHDRILIRDGSKLVMVASDDPDSWPPVPFVRREDFGKSHSMTEVIRAKVSLGPEYGPDITPRIKKFLSKFGSIVAANEQGDFVLQDSARSLRFVVWLMSGKD